MKKIFIISSAVLIGGLGVALLAGTPAHAVELYQACGVGGASNVCAGTGDEVEPFIKSAVNTLLYIIGALAVVMLIIGGIRYTISGGNSQQITAAKNTILYAVIGLVLAAFAYAIVNFVIFRLGLDK